MAKSTTNVLSKIFDAVAYFDTRVDLDGSLSGKFKIKRRTNRKGIDSVRGTFKFQDDIIAGLKTNFYFTDKSPDSLFGDFSDDNLLGNPRTVKSGNKKFDYSYNGRNNDILTSNNFVGERKKLAELSVFPEFTSTFESQKARVRRGYFRVSLDGNFAVFGTGNKKSFDNILMRADYEPAFHFLDPGFGF